MAREIYDSREATPAQQRTGHERPRTVSAIHHQLRARRRRNLIDALRQLPEGDVDRAGHMSVRKLQPGAHVENRRRAAGLDARRERRRTDAAVHAVLAPAGTGTVIAAIASATT